MEGGRFAASDAIAYSTVRMIDINSELLYDRRAFGVSRFVARARAPSRKTAIAKKHIFHRFLNFLGFVIIKIKDTNSHIKVIYQYLHFSVLKVL